MNGARASIFSFSVMQKLKIEALAPQKEAVNLAWELRPDVLIMDVSMPIMSGPEATCQIKGLLPEIRIVALSMYEEPETIERMYQAGAESFLLKTVASEELLAAIRGRDLPKQQAPPSFPGTRS